MNHSANQNNNAPWLSVEGVTRRYGDKTALDALSFDIRERGVAGFLGRNGAGKSTLLRILIGQDLPTSGKARLFGEDPFDNPGVLRRVCMVQDHPDPGALKGVRDLLAVSHATYPKWDDAFAERLIKRFELDTRKKLKALSRGMHTSLALVIGLASGAELTLFDEPSLGLDAVMRERFYDTLIETRGKTDRCFLVSTHLIEEAARTLDTVRMIENGKLLAGGTVAELTGSAFTMTGPVVEPPPGVKVLRRDTRDGLVTLACQGERPHTPPPNVTIAPVSLQRLFVLLTESGKEA
ncbi:MAG: ABC transporter ATP-binding protein [Oscillospiraceae bacterium]|jgi:ABC-2 type transport system ATP-binding protein|nr:ABC transporter ATP-binding protein [Oscillospiraceae bacterium]